MTTKRQKQAVLFIQEELEITFKGNINNFDEVSEFIGEYLDDAKSHYEEMEFLYREALGSIGDIDTFMYGD